MTAPARPPDGPQVEIVEGTPTTLADHTRLEVTHVGYAHLVESKNLSTCTLIVERDGRRVELPLAREHGGSDPESSGSALGWRFTLEMADPYSRPSRVFVRVRKL